MKKASSFVFMFLSLFCFSQTQAEMNIESYNNFKKADKELNLVYDKILKKYSNDKLFIKKLKISQNLWIKFRDAEAEAKFPAEDAKFEYGTIFPVCYNSFLEDLTKKRITELKEWLFGYDDGNVCNGSIK